MKLDIQKLVVNEEYKHLTLRAAAILVQIQRGKETAIEISKILNIEEAATCRSVNNLIKLGLVNSRVDANDMRKHILSATPQALVFFNG
jgi:DNA-binding MarR family transcriptional regulator